MPHYYLHSYIRYSCACLVIFVFSATASGADLDTQLRIDQNIEHRSRAQEQLLLKDEDYQAQQHPQLIVDGKSYPVGHNVNDLGRALYTSIKEKKWSAAAYFLTQYQTLANIDPLLLAYAKGALARFKGDMQTAINEYRLLLTLNDKFLPGQLELARVLFEDHQDKEARAVFDKIAVHLNIDNPQHAGVNRSVTSFNKALDKRSDWDFSLSFGSIWRDNLNQSSQSETCLLSFQGQCIYTRTIPKAISARGVDYQLTASKALALKGHHGLYTRSLLYGQKFDEFPDYNQSTLNTQWGYRYQDLNDQIRLSPQYEISNYANKTLFSALGLHGEWTHNISRQTMFKFNVDYKEMRYKQDNYQRYDGPSYSVNATAWQELDNNWTLFGGVDWLNRLAEDSPYAYRQIGARIGVSKNYSNKISTTLFGSVRQQTYHAFSNILGERRKDRTKNITLVVKAPRLSVQGFVPSLTLKHSDTRSNVDWLYSQRSNEIILKIEKSF